MSWFYLLPNYFLQCCMVATWVTNIVKKQAKTNNTSLAVTFFKIQFWYLRCCSCPWNRGRQHLATPLETCHNTEAGFLQGGCSAYPPTQRWRHLRLRRSRTWAVCLPLSPQKGDHPPSHDDNFARTSVCRILLVNFLCTDSIEIMSFFNVGDHSGLLYSKIGRA